MRNLRLHLVFALFATVGWFPGVGFEAAWASAWLLPPGDGQIITYAGFSDSTRAFDGHGNLIPVPDYQKFELGTYVEYGVTDWLTLAYPVCCQYDELVIICRSGLPRLSNNASRFSAGFSR